MRFSKTNFSSSLSLFHHNRHNLSLEVMTSKVSCYVFEKQLTKNMDIFRSFFFFLKNKVNGLNNKTDCLILHQKLYKYLMI